MFLPMVKQEIDDSRAARATAGEPVICEGSEEIGFEIPASVLPREQWKLNMDDIDVLECYPSDLPDKAKGHRHWGRISWLYLGDLICQISGETAKAIDAAMRQPQEEKK